MRYAAVAASAGLAWFLLVSALVSLGVALAVRAASARAASRFDRAPAALWLLLRLMPALGGLLVVVTMFGPAFSRFEPEAPAEPVGLGLIVLAGLSLVLVGGAWLRALMGWRRAALQARAWMRTVQGPVDCAGALDVSVVSDPAPTVALVGLWRPRLVVSRAVVDALTPDELRIVIDHEREHQRARDNLKRLAVLAAPDVLGLLGTARALEARWVRAAECEADRRAARGDPGNGVTLASALIRVARLMPGASPTAAPITHLYSGGPLTARIEGLARLHAEPRRYSPLPWLAIAAVPLLWWGANSAPLLRAVHHLTELLVGLAG